MTLKQSTYTALGVVEHVESRLFDNTEYKTGNWYVACDWYVLCERSLKKIRPTRSSPVTLLRTHKINSFHNENNFTDTCECWNKHESKARNWVPARRSVARPGSLTKDPNPPQFMKLGLQIVASKNVYRHVWPKPVNAEINKSKATCKKILGQTRFGSSHLHKPCKDRSAIHGCPIQPINLIKSCTDPTSRTQKLQLTSWLSWLGRGRPWPTNIQPLSCH